MGTQEIVTRVLDSMGYQSLASNACNQIQENYIKKQDCTMAYIGGEVLKEEVHCLFISTAIYIRSDSTNLKQNGLSILL